MGFWGKTLGIGFGFMVGGPLGAIIGGAIGHMYDKQAEQLTGAGGVRCPHCNHIVRPLSDGRCPVCGLEIHARPLESSFDRQFIFYVSLASLAAKMAKADGVVTRDEVEAFDQFVRNELRLNTEERKVIARLFNEAKNSPQDYRDFALQFKQLLGHQREVLHTMVHLLFRIAMADGAFHPAEEAFIRNVSRIFGLSQMEYDQISALFIQKTDRAYKILGLTPRATDDEIRAAYKNLVREYHPDKLMAKGVPEDFIKIANEKMAEINNAYEQIKKERGL